MTLADGPANVDGSLIQEDAQIEAWGVLEIRAPGGLEHEVRLTDETVTIGRDSENAVVLDDDHVSRRHARIERDDAGCSIIDLGSANGTRIAAEELEPRVPHTLSDGVSSTIGPFRLTLRISPERVAAASETPAEAGATIATPTAGPTVIARPAERLVVSTPSGTTEVALKGELLTLGRSSDCDVVIDDSVVSRHHADLCRVAGGWEISDAGSLNGLTLDGKKVQSHRLNDGDVIAISDTVTLAYSASAEAAAPGGTIVQTLPLREQAELSIGRDLTNDVRLAHPAVSRHHARIARSGDGYTIEDLGSGNGTFANGERLAPHLPLPLARGDTVRIGPVRFTMEMEGIQQVDESRDLRLDGVHLNQYVAKTLNLLQDISLSLEGREFVALVGVSGAGKSTLLDALNGFRPARAGQVLVNGVDLYDNFDAYRTDLGYVPQDDIIHKELPVARALSYSAQLRLPPDTTKSEREERIETVMATLNLSERRDLPIARLSGGQRKRVSIGAELLMKPSLFFLDEATSGLDPGTESQMMHLLRALADQGHTVVLVTHATKNVMLCDQVVFLAKGGHLGLVRAARRGAQVLRGGRLRRHLRAPGRRAFARCLGTEVRRVAGVRPLCPPAAAQTLSQLQRRGDRSGRRRARRT